MHAKDFTKQDIVVPTLNRKYDYDLMLQDFLPPIGKGKVADVCILATGVSDGNGKANISLLIKTNESDSGFVKFMTADRERGSQLWSDYLAPEDGYASSITLQYDSANASQYMNQDSAVNYYFRVRGKLNPATNQQEWHYGTRVPKANATV